MFSRRPSKNKININHASMNLITEAKNKNKKSKNKNKIGLLSVVKNLYLNQDEY
jgi:hypothetical protein